MLQLRASDNAEAAYFVERCNVIRTILWCIGGVLVGRFLGGAVGVGMMGMSPVAAVNGGQLLGGLTGAFLGFIGVFSFGGRGGGAEGAGSGGVGGK